MIDVNKALKNVAKKGKVMAGKKQTQAAIKNGNAKLIILANNCPYAREISTLAEEKNVPIYSYGANNVELGYACGKSYAISSFAILDEADTNILQLVKKRK